MKKLLYIITLFMFAQTLWAQQNNTMYFTETTPQTRWLNPAKQTECKFHLGGAIIPITGQLLFPVHINYGNNGFALKDMLQYNADMDSLVLPGFKGYDWNQLEGNLREVNFMTFETHINWLTVGYKFKDWYIGLDVTDKIDARFSFNQDLIRFAKEGNAQTFLTETANLGDLGITATAYSEYAVNVSKKINPQLTVGLTAKVLFGKSNIWTERSIIDLSTNNNDNYPITVNADVMVHSSQPAYEIKEMYYDYQGDSLVFETEEQTVDPADTYLNFKNMGLGFDVGAIYKFNDKIELQASLMDIGYINWKTNPHTLSVKGEYYWDGYDFQPQLTEDEDLITEANDSLKHHIINIFEPSLQKDSYKTYLTPKAYLGASYKLNHKIKAGLLLRAAFYQQAFHPSLTLSANFRLARWFETVASYSIINNSYSNVGIGFAARAKWFQFFMMSDNVFGFIWPQSTRNINFRMGMNLIFGCKKKQNVTLIH